MKSVSAKLLVCALLGTIVFLAGCATPHKNSSSKSKPIGVAVADLVAVKTTAAEAARWSDALRYALADSKQFQVVSAEYVSYVFNEAQLSAKHREATRKNLKRMAELLEVDRMIGGKVKPDGSNMTLILKMVDVRDDESEPAMRREWALPRNRNADLGTLARSLEPVVKVLISEGKKKRKRIARRKVRKGMDLVLPP